MRYSYETQNLDGRRVVRLHSKFLNYTHMNTIIVSVGDYGFGHNWTLVMGGKQFYLGQDVKFCKRVLGMSPSDVVDAIGDNDLRKEETRDALANFIIDTLQIEGENIESWELCCQ